MSIFFRKLQTSTIFKNFSDLIKKQNFSCKKKKPLSQDLISVPYKNIENNWGRPNKLHSEKRTNMTMYPAEKARDFASSKASYTDFFLMFVLVTCNLYSKTTVKYTKLLYQPQKSSQVFGLTWNSIHVVFVTTYSRQQTLECSWDREIWIIISKHCYVQLILFIKIDFKRPWNKYPSDSFVIYDIHI